MINHKLAYGLEIVWAIVTLIAFGLAIYNSIHQGIFNSKGLYLITLVAFLMYFLRRNRRLHNK